VVPCSVVAPPEDASVEAAPPAVGSEAVPPPIEDSADATGAESAIASTAPVIRDIHLVVFRMAKLSS
jgi:hypothetical protein